MRLLACAFAAVALLAVAVGQLPPTPTQTDPLALTGGLIAEFTGESCDDIFVGDPDSDGTTESLNCNKATVLTLQVPLSETFGDGVTFDFTPNGQSGGGSYHTPPDECAKGPGYCLYGQPFKISIQVSPVATAYDLTMMHIVSPFAYMYENCLSLAPSTSDTFYPYYAEGTCGPADIWNLEDYHMCESPESWPYWYETDPLARPKFATNYTVCAFMCGWELERIMSTVLCPTCGGDYAGQTLAFWCNNYPGNVRDVITDYFSDDVSTLACDHATAWVDAVQELMPNYPRPSGICPCVNSATTMDLDPNANAPSGTPPPVSSQATGPFSSIVACKSCAGAGLCGTALPRPEPTDPAMCTEVTTEDVDTVCDCVPGDGNSDGGFTPEDDPVNDPNTVCFNTNQRHRCLKCQPSMVDENLHTQTDFEDEYCAYTDINAYALCISYWADICGAGDYTLADRQRDTNDQGQRTAASIGFCNCKANFIERSYWVAPFCAPYRIVNPSSLQYAITVTLLYADGTRVPNGSMTVGSGWSPFVNPGDPPGNGGGGVTLPWLNATVDGFAVTQIIEEYTESGALTTNLPGAIVVCDNGKERPYCGFLTQNENGTNATAPDPSNVPNPNILAAGWSGFQNPWPPIQNATCASVPLPDFIYNNTGFSGNLDANQATWWYYVPPEDLDTFGLSCGQNGWTLVGSADVASSQTMCNNLQGTCVPGIDEQFRGEAIKPPCSVATDLLNYVDRWMKRSGDTPEEINDKDHATQPPHVPPTWTTSQATYAVNRGKLMRYDDPVVINKWAAARVRISVAADFGGTTVAQAGGTAVATGCTITTQDGFGLYNVDVTNTGTVAAQYAFRQGECTPGLNFTTQIQSIAPTATSGTGEPAHLALSITASALYGTPGNDASAQSCSIIMTPSLDPAAILATTDLTPCIPQYGLPQIAPILAANVTYGEGIADSFDHVPPVNGPQCGFWCAVFNPLDNRQFLTPLEWTVITFMFSLFIFVAIVMTCVCIGQQITVTREEELQYAETMKASERRMQADLTLVANTN